jgi:hypothetical protein
LIYVNGTPLPLLTFLNLKGRAAWFMLHCEGMETMLSSTTDDLSGGGIMKAGERMTLCYQNHGTRRRRGCVTAFSFHQLPGPLT